jgi:hypothetical protein
MYLLSLKLVTQQKAVAHNKRRTCMQCKHTHTGTVGQTHTQMHTHTHTHTHIETHTVSGQVDRLIDRSVVRRRRSAGSGARTISRTHVATAAKDRVYLCGIGRAGFLFASSNRPALQGIKPIASVLVSHWSTQSPPKPFINPLTPQHSQSHDNMTKSTTLRVVLCLRVVFSVLHVEESSGEEQCIRAVEESSKGEQWRAEQWSGRREQ